MYASGFKARQAPALTSLPNSKRPKLDVTAMTTRSTTSDIMTKRTNNSATTTSSRIAALRSTNTTTNSKVIGNPAMAKSKFTERKSTATNALPLVNNHVSRPLKPTRVFNSTDTVTSSKFPMRSKEDSKKPIMGATARKPDSLPLFGATVRSKSSSSQRSTWTSSANGTRRWNAKNTNSPLPPSNNFKITDNLDPAQRAIEIGVQTQEQEILNHSLLVGDIKFLMPSRRIIDEIEKLRKEIKTKQMLKTTRKFEEHSERQEEHLNDLKEFLEKSYVSKRQRKSRDSFEEDRNAMDQLINREVPTSESITDIRARIKRKEQELLKLFDNVDSTARLLVNNN